MSAISRSSLTLDPTNEEINEVRLRLRNTRWPASWPVTGWEAGTDQEELRRLVSYWAEDFDWVAQRRHIDALPWHTADIDGTALAYLRFDPEKQGGLPLILT